MFGEHRLRESLEAQRGTAGSVEELIEAVHEAVRRWAGILVDDSTALAVRMR